jgi:hypothetical protein
VPTEEDNAAERIDRIARLVRELTKHTDALYEEIRTAHEQLAENARARVEHAKAARQRAVAASKRHRSRSARTSDS